MTGNPSSIAQSHYGSTSQSRTGKTQSFANVTPWVLNLFFFHTYYAYICVFYLFVLAYYKGFAMQYPRFRRAQEMVLVMVLPVTQHLRFYLGYWGCQVGEPYYLVGFLFLCVGLSWAFFYFLFLQAYIMPLESALVYPTVIGVFVEAGCGMINAIRPCHWQDTSRTHIFFVVLSAALMLLTYGAFFAMFCMYPFDHPAEEAQNYYTALLQHFRGSLRHSG
mmetsp:Transcript_5352/g.11835  ORF Transcript_5352/g.11835 Transcript_5352/m.11835 type:complete len:220 (+) Transcript_5352:49-708(+)|eukprot:CAMPEP_0178418800 /NCGR_PEP_ID=MMETSP0689_2-20121128/25277_1 /TAXON_ID=160604 /ORGANISM="Amphidinium massartii, Strain CS-259" /LENGTH=219 /DNA_ID=CAMNT_0020040209 /DNA_START=5 /DNA_END=664 /DNA_ORIENTATION=+